MSDPREKVRRLIALATAASAAPGEAGNAALAAVRLIAKHDLLGPAPAAARPDPFRGTGKNPWDDLEDMMREARQKQEREAREREANRVHAERERAAAETRKRAAEETARKHAAAAKAREKNPTVQQQTFTGADGREYSVWVTPEDDRVSSAHVRATDRKDTAKKAGVSYVDDFNAAVRDAFKVEYPDGFPSGKQRVRMPPIDFSKIGFDTMPFAGVNHPATPKPKRWSAVSNVHEGTLCKLCGKAVPATQGVYAAHVWNKDSGGALVQCFDCGPFCI